MIVAKAELNYYPEEVSEKKIIENNKKNIKKKSNKKDNKAKVIFKLACISVTVVILLVSLFILYRYENISKMRMEVNKLEKDKLELERTKSVLVTELEELKSSLKITEDAKYKLGMSYPQESQIVYVSVDDVKTESTKTNGIFSQFNKVFGLFSSLF
ncbi:septum formation initiator family protein [Wansuia hejianensis]|uniref:Cell division protein FtsL n=1 Tax=Wansuia hejianensis TaxID=2763667 RepID=A0A926F060_9FIRM|nr:cell division protein FtsL [Wansuia hejianensis]MBC8590717.1 cell division protein FtsL [Wansuia hejianensis]